MTGRNAGMRDGVKPSALGRRSGSEIGGRARLVPPVQAHNPSAWRHRLVVALAALAGCGIAGYLALYQWGVDSRVWEPFFGSGSDAILHSHLAEALPVPDAALGVAAYLSEAVAVLVAGRT